MQSENALSRLVIQLQELDLFIYLLRTKQQNQSHTLRHIHPNIHKITMQKTQLTKRLYTNDVWNGLPSDVTSASLLSVFKNRLKKYLFRLCYETV